MDLDIIDIGFDNLPTANFSSASGVELLMNNNASSDKRTVRSGTNAINSLDDELSSFANNRPEKSSSNNGFFSGMDNASIFSNEPASSSGIGFDTKQCYNDSYKNGSSDGFIKLDTEIPTMSYNTSSDGYNNSSSSSTYNTSANEARKMRQQKMKWLKDMDRWFDAGLIKQRSVHNNDSKYEDVEDEYLSITDDKHRTASIKMQGEILKTIVGTLEWGNQAYNPFDIDLEGWKEQVSDNIGEQDEVFSQLHDRYKDRKVPPEISLLMSVVGSGLAIAASNRMLNSVSPEFASILKQKPGASSSGPSMNSDAFNTFNRNMRDEPINMNYGPPPAPMETKNMGTVPKQQQSKQQGQQKSSLSRPDITQQDRYQSYSPSNNTTETGIEINMPSAYSSTNESKPILQQQSMRPEMKKPFSMANNMNNNNNIDVTNSNNEVNPPPSVSNILFGLKPKINKHNGTENSQYSLQSQINVEDSSIISLSAMDELDSMQLPKRNRKKKESNSSSSNNSNSNIITLDI